MENKIVNFNDVKSIKNNKLKQEYEGTPSVTDDMSWIIKGLETGIIKELDMLFEFEGEILYFGTNKSEVKNEISKDLFEKVRKLKAKAKIE